MWCGTELFKPKKIHLRKQLLISIHPWLLIMEKPKTINTLVVDTGPLIKNDPAVSSLIAAAETLVTHPSVIGEIRDAATRSRLETTLQPFLTLREPRIESVKFIQDFARRSGDLQALSRPDVLLLALTYEVECERNGGDWRLRKAPGQKGLNGKPPSNNEPEHEEKETGQPVEDIGDEVEGGQPLAEGPADFDTERQSTNDIEEALKETRITDTAVLTPDTLPKPTSEESESDSDEWITPSNLAKRQADDATAPSSSTASKGQVLQAAILTTDYAMQNVALLLNLNLVSSSLTRITQLRNTIQRCHACFFVIRPTSDSSTKPKQFCPRCGLPTLTKVSCSTSATDGTFRIHLKKNMQWNNRGSRYSVPKPATGSSSGRVTGGGGKGGWGNGLMLAEDQKEYVRAVQTQERQARKEKDLMDDDFLGGLLGGGKGNWGGRSGGRVKVGAGRDVNAKKRK